MPANRLRLGSYDRIALELPGNPLGLQRDDLMFEKADGTRTAALLANVSGTTLVYVDVGGHVRPRSCRQGQRRDDGVRARLADRLYGADIKKAIKRSHATQWNNSPWALGAFSAAAVGAQPSRRMLMEPLRDRVFFAGEAAHETLWGTVGGAWESGERAADAALRLFGSASKPQATQPQRPQRRQRCKPKALIAWSSGKDSAWALHEVRRAGDYDIVGALTTVTDTFARVSMHGVREELLRAQLDAAGLAARSIVRIPFPCPNDVYEARMAAAMAHAKRQTASRM